ncbi:MAG TPA: FAD-dependent oxidoreductase [bacterium]|nr:FAD-dependent oxidoreductase [bacterium]
MIRELEEMSANEHDVLIAGGGIQGVAVAREIAARGMSVALVEQDDFGARTSANSQRMIHGGMRYLQTLDFARMRRSALDRREWMREFPHLIRPVPILMPTFAGSGKPRWMISSGMTLYESLTADCNQGLPAAVRLPRHEKWSRQQVLAALPELEHRGVAGGVLFHDALVLNTERLTLAVAKEAWKAGARLANHARAEEWIVEKSSVRGAVVRDLLNGRDHAIRARAVIHAGGPWAANQGKPRVGLVRVMALLLPSIESRFAIAIPSPKESRLFFLTPWRGRTLAGVQEAVHEGDSSEPNIAAEEIDAYLEDLQEAFGRGRFRRGDVLRVYAGLLPASPDEPRSPASEDRILEDASGLVRVLGVKYTTAPSLARRVAQMMQDRLGRGGARSPNRPGETIPSLPRENDPLFLYGPEADEIRALENESPDLARPLVEGCSVVRAQVVYAVRREMAMTLGDIALRRTELAAFEPPGDPAMKACADLTGELLGWDERRRREEVSELIKSLEKPAEIDSLPAPR